VAIEYLPTQKWAKQGRVADFDYQQITKDTPAIMQFERGIRAGSGPPMADVFRHKKKTGELRSRPVSQNKKQFQSNSRP
jgi:hypothetical protein